MDKYTRHFIKKYGEDKFMRIICYSKVLSSPKIAGLVSLSRFIVYRIVKREKQKSHKAKDD
ncbi:hypothetical protein M0R04_12170 [Candidatus Dojkabacteria bacterium]|jgi:hypothetical protein|nr:hypothetical protein [Candidatus Dojkabacteria bacterium]